MTATNIGSSASGPVVIKDTLPAGVTFEGFGESNKDRYAYEPENGNGLGEGVGCTDAGQVVTCSYGSPLRPGGVVSVFISVGVSVGSGSVLLNGAVIEEEVEGRLVLKARTEEPSTGPTVVDGETPRFGVQNFSIGVFGPDGKRDVQAGSHPTAIETTVAYNTVTALTGLNDEVYPSVEEPKVQNTDLPMGFLGDPLVVPRCTEAALAAESCPVDTRVGAVGLFQEEGRNDEFRGLYDVVPEASYPAQFGFVYLHTVIMLRARVLPTSGGYVLSVPVPAVPRSENTKVHEVSVTFFGDPGLVDGGPAGEAFATNPDACGSGPLDASMEMNAWVYPTDWQSAVSPMFEAGSGQGVTGCGALQFDPSMSVAPEETTVDTPSGYLVSVKVPQSPDLEGVLATPDLKNALVSLPPGTSISPSAANGLVACQESGAEGIELGDQDRVDADQVASEVGAKEGGAVQEGEVLGADGLVHASAGHCPLASQIGEVEVVTPVLEQPLKGHVYVAAPGCGGVGQPVCTPASAEDGELFGLYLEVAGSGVIVKLHGKAFVNPSTGQITTRFEEAPQDPVSEIRLRLNGGSRAPLANSSTCGTQTTTSDLTPWSTPYTPDATPSSTFSVTGCAGDPFNPTFTAGMSGTLHAGSYSPFALEFSRKDGEQDLSGLSVTMPPGLAGKIAGFTECGQAEIAAAIANTGSCPASSRVGTATAAAGSGGSPFYQSGPVFLTGPYRGGSFGLAVVVPANAGPFHLGNVVVRAGIYVNPQDTRVTVVSDPLPQMIDGVPLRVKHVKVVVGEEGNFTFNATNCTKGTIGATISSSQGANAQVSAPYGAAGCADIGFAPKFEASTQGNGTTKGHGASLKVKIGYPAPFTSYANIAKTDVSLPFALSSRLTTLQKACTEKQFATNPAGCPPASAVGTAKAVTPLLKTPLEGPAYLVSHGGRAFPDLVIMLQGEGVQINLTGNTQIKNGITNTKFETVPDAPVSSFELLLPEKENSILGAIKNLCAPTKTVTASKKVVKLVNGKRKRVTVKLVKVEPEPLIMPTSMTGQNGRVITQSTKISVTGCKPAKPATKATAKKPKKGK